MDHLQAIVGIGLDLRFSEGQQCPLLAGKRFGLITRMSRLRIAGQGKRQQPLRLWPSVIEGDHLQVTAAADHFALAALARYALDRVVDPQLRRPPMDWRALVATIECLNVAPAFLGRQPLLRDLGSGCQHRLAHGIGHFGLSDIQAAWCVHGIGRVERHSPDAVILQQFVHHLLEVHQAQAGLQVGTAVPRLEAQAHRLQGWRIAAQALRTQLQQVGQHLIGQVHPVVHDHPLQILRLHRPIFLQLRQTLQGKACTRAQGQSFTADHWRKTGQRRRRVDQPGRIIGVLHEVAAVHLRQLVRRENAFLHAVGRYIPGAILA
ncbi:hypothetical protein D3C76_911740 [compost metagenome]